jgi:hypothetical protein
MDTNRLEKVNYTRVFSYLPAAKCLWVVVERQHFLLGHGRGFHMLRLPIRVQGKTVQPVEVESGF